MALFILTWTISIDTHKLTFDAWHHRVLIWDLHWATGTFPLKLFLNSHVHEFPENLVRSHELQQGFGLPGMTIDYTATLQRPTRSVGLVHCLRTHLT